MIQWSDEQETGVVFIPAKRCAKKEGIMDVLGTPKLTPHFIYVDDNILADAQLCMHYTSAAGLKAISDLLG